MRVLLGSGMRLMDHSLLVNLLCSSRCLEIRVAAPQTTTRKHRAPDSELSS